MNKEQVKALLKIISTNYPNFINENNFKDILSTWATELSQYSYKDVESQLKELLAKSEFQMKPPTLYHITCNLTKTSEKIDYSEMTVFCSNCGRVFNSIEKMMEHKERCNSVEYICNQWKKWYGKELTKADIRTLYEMEETPFRERYNKLLHYIHEHTKDENEKTIISYIFNPPNQETAQKFISNASI